MLLFKCAMPKKDVVFFSIKLRNCISEARLAFLRDRGGNL